MRFLVLLVAVALSIGSVSARTEIESPKARALGGDAFAQFSLGFIYANGEGVAENDAEAVKWYRLAAEQGNVFGQFSLGFMYVNGEGVTKNEVEAVKWYRLAAEQGYAKAQADLGIMYAKGDGVPQDDVQAYKWVTLAATQGNENAKGFTEWLEARMTREQIAEV